MKNALYTSLIILLAACNSNESGRVYTSNSKTKDLIKHNNQAQFKPYQIAGQFTVTDTGYFNTGIGDGVYAVLERNHKFIDTISLFYNVKSISPNRFLYLTVEGYGQAKREDSNPKYKKSIYGSEKSYVILSGEKKTRISDINREFDDYFSSPQVINNKIYFWAIKKLDSSGRIQVSAAQFDPNSNSTENHYLMNDILETDDGGYYPPPILKKDTICFVFSKKKQWKFSPSFNLYK